MFNLYSFKKKVMTPKVVGHKDVLILKEDFETIEKISIGT